MSYIYLACPIDQSTVDSRSQSTALLRHLRGQPYYSPSDAWRWPVGQPYPSAIQATNLVALQQAAVIIAIWDRGTPSVGMPMEVQKALDLSIPVMVLSPQPKGSSAAWAHADVEWTHEPRFAVEWARIKLAQHRSTTHEPTGPVGAIQGRWAHLEQDAYHHADRAARLAEAPRPGRAGDAGYDLVASESITIQPGHQCSIPSGIAVQMPDGYWALVQGRSSSWKLGLLVKSSIIDAGYRGELWVDCYNLGRHPVEVTAGERIGQLVPMPLAPRIEWEEVLVLSPSERGADGYGSSGR